MLVVESVKLVATMGPNEIDVADIPGPDLGFVWTGIQQPPLQVPHEEVGVAGSHACKYGRPMCL